MGRGQGLSSARTAEEMSRRQQQSHWLLQRHSSLTFFNLQASSAPLFLQVEPVELVELVELVGEPMGVVPSQRLFGTVSSAIYPLALDGQIISAASPTIELSAAFGLAAFSPRAWGFP